MMDLRYSADLAIPDNIVVNTERRGSSDILPINGVVLIVLDEEPYNCPGGRHDLTTGRDGGSLIFVEFRTQKLPGVMADAAAGFHPGRLLGWFEIHLVGFQVGSAVRAGYLHRQCIVA
jgi:hypothetical protein